MWLHGHVADSVRRSGTLPEACRIDAKAHCRCSGGWCWPVTLLTRVMLVFSMNSSLVYLCASTKDHPRPTRLGAIYNNLSAELPAHESAHLFPAAIRQVSVKWNVCTLETCVETPYQRSKPSPFSFSMETGSVFHIRGKRRTRLWLTYTHPTSVTSLHRVRCCALDFLLAFFPSQIRQERETGDHTDPGVSAVTYS